MQAHVILVAFTVTAPDMEQAQKQLMSQLPNCRDTPGVAGIDSWYIAENERYDGTKPEDGSSAVFADPKEVVVRLDYDEAIAFYELLRRDVCSTALVNENRRSRAGRWADAIYDAIDQHERLG